MNHTQYRQGDVFLESVAAVPDDCQEISRDRGLVVLAYGEATGHAHLIDHSNVRLLESDELEDRFLEVLAESGVDLRHGLLAAPKTQAEHDTVHLDPGVYRVTGFDTGQGRATQREYAPEEIQRVVD